MRVAVVGAGIVGACTALATVRAGCDVVLFDRGVVGSGTTSRGEGNILVSDKPPGPELDLALNSRSRWNDLGDELGPDSLELEGKGGLVVATEPAALAPLQELAAAQSTSGVAAEPIEDLLSLEPQLASGLPGGYWYPQDAQVQPVLAAAAIVAAAVRQGVRLLPRTEVVAAERTRTGALRAVRTHKGETVPVDAVVNAAGTWGAQVGERLGAPIPVLPRRGYILVTEPLPPLIRHKVYSADYVANVAASTEGLETSCVVESTRGGTVLIGASRERVGFDSTLRQATVVALAGQAVALFPFLRGVHLLRVYHGFRPYCPDHLPMIGPDPRAQGVLHACGHEGAGIGLAPATGELIAAHLLGDDVHSRVGIDPRPFLPDRLVSGTHAMEP